MRFRIALQLFAASFTSTAARILSGTPAGSAKKFGKRLQLFAMSAFFI
jgi:hypothetical protein